MIARDEYGLNVDQIDIMNFSHWIAVLAAPHLYRTMTRHPDPALLTKYMDMWVTYAERGDWYWGKPDEDRSRLLERIPLSRKLRDLIAAWTPPELPNEIVEAARALLDAEGLKPPPKKGESWDELDFGGPVEDFLIWPEGIPAKIREAQEREEYRKQMEQDIEAGMDCLRAIDQALRSFDPGPPRSQWLEALPKLAHALFWTNALGFEARGLADEIFGRISHWQRTGKPLDDLRAKVESLLNRRRAAPPPSDP
jgi:hypothetical protein